MRDGRMHQTTVRFGPDLWAALEEECARLGVSAAQYLREAALARLSYTAGRRGETEYEHALVGAGVPAETPPDVRVAHDAREDSAEQRLAATAVSNQSEQVRRRAREVRAQSIELRGLARTATGR
ncbi:MAG TPA: hypothetical protein VF066_12230 [Thermoleophilaceae bacterium]